LFLKLTQSLTNLKVYTLLLNVDYVPILKNVKLPEIVEFGLHMMISIVLAIGINFYITKKDLHKETIQSFVIRVSLVVGVLLFPTTLLSERTPSLTNIYAFIFWMVGHLFYGLVLGRVLSNKEGLKA
jgi:hypothetical protein